jgi:hypothetical protein
MTSGLFQVISVTCTINLEASHCEPDKLALYIYTVTHLAAVSSMTTRGYHRSFAY